MIKVGDSSCPLCGGLLLYYDKVNRLVRTKYRKTYYVKLRRLQCQCCGRIHRELPDYILPYKQYESEIIFGVIERLIDCNTFGYEDYPCEKTMFRWFTRNIQFLL